MAGSKTLPTDPRQVALITLASFFAGFYGWRCDPERAGLGKQVMLSRSIFIPLLNLQGIDEAPKN
jgi:hypothetical protein